MNSPITANVNSILRKPIFGRTRVEALLPRPEQTDTARARLIIRLLTILSIGIVAGVFFAGATVLYESRKDAWQQALNSTANLTLALDRDISRNITIYDLSARGVIKVLREPGLEQLSPSLRRAALFDQATTAEYFGSMLVLNARGDAIESSLGAPPSDMNLSSHDYFTYPRDHPDAGLFISAPYKSLLRNGDPSIAISRRIVGPDGRFNGAALGSLRLAYFQALFSNYSLGQRGTISLMRADGLLLARFPSIQADVGRDLSAAAGFKVMSSAASGHFVGVGSLDGVKRLITYRHVDKLPLIVSVSRSVVDIYAAWWRRAILIGAILTILCGATMTLCILFRREMLKRLTAESELREAARQLSVIALTDALTGLGNRRHFDETIDREWRRAIRSESSIALLLLDVDKFKLYNDRYGHPEGDGVLQSIAACIGGNLRRPSDIGARYGGEEFVILLPETDASGAVLIAEQIRAAVLAKDIPHLGHAAGRVTVSIGVAAMRPRPDDNSDILVQQADKGLYEAKSRGRNQVYFDEAEALHEHADILDHVLRTVSATPAMISPSAS
jgi:diguanylate cyclase (GGDEF)-like protein